MTDPLASKTWLDNGPPVHDVVEAEHAVTIPLTVVYPGAATVQLVALT